jgi:hypothetical protein
MEKNIENTDWTKIEAEADSIIESAHIDFEELDWLHQLLIQKLSKKELYNSYINTVTLYYSLLEKSIEEEKFEISAKLKKVISIEKETFRETLMKYFQYNKQDESKLEKITAKAEEIFLPKN